MTGLRDQAQQLRRRAALLAGSTMTQPRSRAHMTLMLLVIALGLPIIGIPSWRQKLRDRVHILGEALISPGSHSPPLVLQVGENKEPFPAEYERPAPSITPWVRAAVAGAPVFRISAGQPTDEVLAGTPQPASSTAGIPGAPEGEIRYSQGPAEQEAYELVRASNERLAALLSGSGQDLRFKDWGAARADDESLLVRVIFTYRTDESERVYIWKVRLSSKEVIPLSAYAKAISRP